MYFFFVLTSYIFWAENMCMLNSKTKFHVPNVPGDAVLLRYCDNILIAYVFDAVTGGKGMAYLQINPGKNQTIANLMLETFPKCFGKEKFPVIRPQTVAYIHALIINSISIAFEDSINARALQHESAMLDVYTKRTPYSFKTQLQAVLTAYYEDIKGVQGASGCPKPKFVTVKCRFEDP
jgi:hypothetical protein